jgi:hypothetical protein
MCPRVWERLDIAGNFVSAASRSLDVVVDRPERRHPSRAS